MGGETAPGISSQESGEMTRNPKFNPRKRFALDTETTGLRYWQGDRAFAVSICDEEMRTWYCEWEVDPFTRTVYPDDRDVEFIGNLCEEPRLAKYFFNRPFDRRMLLGMGVDVYGESHDVYVQARVCRTDEVSYKLKYLCKKYRIMGNEDESELQKLTVKARRQGKKRGWRLAEAVEADYWMCRAVWVDDRTCETYAVKDAERTMLLAFMYEMLMQRDADRRRTYEQEQEVFPEIWAMEQRGIRYDAELNRGEREKNLNAREKHLQKLREMTGNPEFNPGSPQQLAKALYSPPPAGFGLKCHRATKAGGDSTDWKALQHHAYHPFVRELGAFRAADQGETLFHGKYDSLAIPDHVTPGGMAMHPSFNQVGAKTLRQSAYDPNVQQAANPKKSFKQNPTNARGPFGPRRAKYANS